MDDELWTMAKTLLEIGAGFFMVYLMGALLLMLLKTIGNWIAAVMRMVLEQTWGKVVAVGLFIWFVVVVFRKG